MSNSPNIITRNKQHEVIMLLIYVVLFYEKSGIGFSNRDLIENLKYIFHFVNDLDADLELEDWNVVEKNRLKIRGVTDFIKECLVLSLKKKEEAIENITPCLKEWAFKRLNLTEQAILILAYIENKYFAVPKVVVINTCIKLAKKYNPDKSSFQFVNASLEVLLI